MGYIIRIELAATIVTVFLLIPANGPVNSALGKTGAPLWSICAVFAASIYYALWPAVARHCSIHGCANTATAIVFGPFLSCAHQSVAFVNWLRSRPKITWGGVGFVLAVLGALFALVGAAIGIGVVLWHFARFWGEVYVVVLGTILIGLMLAVLINNMRMRSRQTRIIRDLSKQINEVDAASLGLILVQLNNQDGLQKVINVLRKNESLQNTRTTALLADLAAAAECERSERNWTLKRETQEWLEQQSPRVLMLVRGMSDGVLDEVSRLVAESVSGAGAAASAV
jgi:hypothetical protein